MHPLPHPGMTIQPKVTFLEHLSRTFFTEHAFCIPPKWLAVGGE